MTKTLVFDGVVYPVISTRNNGDHLIGYPNTEPAEFLYAKHTPPVHGLAKGSGNPLVADVRIGDRLAIHRHGDHWLVSGPSGPLGRLRWSVADQGRRHAVSGEVIHFPDTATLEVKRLVINPSGQVVDFAGMTSQA
ncbi:hypothetical protein [Nakamurella sp.]|uniref:hypothetical protein n=1 Tax=Nakamurella sp. TaxID=1869182 RepID=UPI003B3B9C4B